ncbi:uncharacterized protein L969DRAFT_48760 [Mixia osmundae IAM 14324]|uniref:Secreted protein n=1 Tax=Mixia osmundae (strain CBS 9802 / IAM 14324 / JCM 22182 / KY 12970) TaxID=764103 RepID=G7E450_MIXOS|nr:uncharacterized protein L969DRAFT_48760 [Mixia osmundae IAM 14324]KEI39705.1 hypothetical protein L969DRAFT_48760 [Mixia osmundae IAM 14324]GAA97610.1 hypothetical protein E5Q_04288 [Mixia osmundae IAM 14324]
MLAVLAAFVAMAAAIALEKRDDFTYTMWITDKDYQNEPSWQFDLTFDISGYYSSASCQVVNGPGKSCVATPEGHKAYQLYSYSKFHFTSPGQWSVHLTFLHSSGGHIISYRLEPTGSVVGLPIVDHQIFLNSNGEPLTES